MFAAVVCCSVCCSGIASGVACVLERVNKPIYTHIHPYLSSTPPVIVATKWVPHHYRYPALGGGYRLYVGGDYNGTPAKGCPPPRRTEGHRTCPEPEPEPPPHPRRRSVGGAAAADGSVVPYLCIFH